MIFLLHLLAAALSVMGAPPVPSLPSSFSVSFVETVQGMDFPVPVSTNGTWYYDFDNGFARMDRNDGSNDRFCSNGNNLMTRKGKQVGSKSNAAFCSLLNRDGWRYILQPMQLRCCKCCNVSSGCGILKPDWLVSSKATFNSTVSNFTNGAWTGPANIFQTQGVVQENFYVERASDHVPLQIYEAPAPFVQYDLLDFDPKTFQAGSQDKSLFEFPFYCLDPIMSCNSGQFPLCSQV